MEEMEPHNQCSSSFPDPRWWAGLIDPGHTERTILIIIVKKSSELGFHSSTWEVVEARAPKVSISIYGIHLAWASYL